MKESSTERGALAGLRVPPQSIEAESSVLGAVLLDNASVDLVTSIISERDFYRHEHQMIWQAANALIQRGGAADVITVFDELQSRGQAESAGGLAYLNSLAQYVPSAANIRGYAEVVRERAVLRSLVLASEQTIANVFDREGRAVPELLDEAERRILSIGENGVKQTAVKTLDTQLALAVDWLQHRAENPGERSGVMSGFTKLDQLTSGLQAGDLVVIAGRPSMGKTSLAMNIADHASFEQELPVLVISLEMEAEQLTRRSIGSVARVSQERIKNGNLTDDDWTRVVEALEHMRGRIRDVLDDGASTLASIRALARRTARKYKGLGLIVVDYLQLMEGQGGGPENRATEIAQISRGLKLLAKELKCPVIALSQLNRSVEQRPDKRPLMSDLRESGAIEQDADTIMFIYRDEYYTKDACKEPGVAEVIIAKQRNGPTGVVKLAWQQHYTRFDNLI